MQVVHINDAKDNTRQAGVMIPALPVDTAQLQELAKVLTGQHAVSRAVRSDASDTALHPLGAEWYIMLVFMQIPDTDGPIYHQVFNWVEKVLDPAMPDGWGAALGNTQPLRGDATEGFTIIHMDAGSQVEWSAKHPLEFRSPMSERTAYAIAIAPMDRSKTQCLGWTTRPRPHWPLISEGVPVLVD